MRYGLYSSNEDGVKTVLYGDKDNAISAAKDVVANSMGLQYCFVMDEEGSVVWKHPSVFDIQRLRIKVREVKLMTLRKRKEAMDLLKLKKPKLNETI